MRSGFRSFVPYALLIAAASACGEHGATTAPSVVLTTTVSFSKQKDNGKKEKVAKCKPQKERYYSAVVGSEGATLKQGDNSLVIPAGALAAPTEIGVHVLPTTSVRVEFSPEGLQFAVPATLTLSYSSCVTPLLGGVQIAYLKADTIVEVEPSRDHLLLQRVSAAISHFSSYAVAF